MPTKTPPKLAEQPGLPEDLNELDDETLAAKLDEIEARAAELRELDDDDWTVELADEAEGLAADGVRLRKLADGREAEKQERLARGRNALAQLDGTAEPEEEVTTEDAAPVEAAAADEDDEDDDEKPPREVVVPDVIMAEDSTEEPALAASVPARTRPRAEDGLRQARTARAKTLAPRPSDGSFMQATNNALGLNEGSRLASPFEVAQAIVRKRLSFNNISPGIRDYLPVATGTKAIDPDDTLSGDQFTNFATLERVRKGHEALVASGGCCAPFTPLYDFFRTAEAQSPLEDALPVVNAPRGGIRYIVPPDFRDAFSAIGTRTCDEDANPATEDKPCVHVDCPSTLECSVVAVSQCVQFGNLGYRVFPEQVQAFLADVAVAFDLAKETMYIACIDAGSTQVTGPSNYGAARALLGDIVIAAVGYRKRNGMRRTAMLQGVFPDWSIDLMKMDLANDGPNGLDYLDVSDAQVIAALRARGIDPVFYNDVGAVATAQAAGALRLLPVNVSWWLFAPGTFVRLDGGTLDVGLVRDSTLNRTNDLELFMEEWTGCCMLGIESVNVISVLCPDGSAPAGVTASCT